MMRYNITLYCMLAAGGMMSACFSSPKSTTQSAKLVEHNSVTFNHIAKPAHSDENSTTVIRIHINHHKVECEGFWIDHCLLYREMGQEQWHYLYDDIEGFDYQWGHEYELLVEVEQLPTAEHIMDLSTTTYRLLQVLYENTHADESFVYVLQHASSVLTRQSHDTYTLPDGKQLRCDYDDCRSIASAISQQHGLTLSLKHDVNTEKPLIIDSILCSSSRPSFADDCRFVYWN